jgi:hypothetical protein
LPQQIANFTTQVRTLRKEASQMKTVMQSQRNKRGVTPAEYVMIGYVSYIFIMIGVKGIGPSLNIDFLAPPANAVVEMHPGDRQ